MSELGWDAVAIASLQSDLLQTKQATDANTFFPSHAFARGGIGILVSTGSARGSLRRLPQANKTCKTLAGSMRPGNSFRNASRPSTCPTLSTFNGSGGFLAGDVAGVASAAAASVLLGPATGVPDVAKHEWERVVPHPANFVTTARQSRVGDVRPASKWAALSLYETDPGVVKRHLDIVDLMDQTHAEGKVIERSNENVRHFTWAVQQRETFRRQRQEAADRYTRSGLPVRKAYSARAAPASYSNSPSFISSPSVDRPVSGSSANYKPVISLPKQTYVNVYARMAAEANDALENSLELSRRRAEEVARKKEADELKNQLREMDGFETHIRGVMRQRARETMNIQELPMDDDY